MKRDINILMVEEDRYEVECLNEAITVGQIISVNIEQAEDGDHALAFLHQEYPYLDAPKPDVIFLNLNVPGMPGRELLNAIKSDQALASIPLVVLTQSEDDKDTVEAYSFDRTCFFFKKPENCQDWLLILKCIEDVWQTFIQYPQSFEK
ncbi:response regulator [Candidatus Nitronereus thalassa]|uniref:Response regulator n=1 Tax=Candidatus Nitronereus thalassa TaxID=3020898 RepID=A0ABU3K3K0_9BACT|nr:response regulator [Candidatus Nitronereus thalassa]MDT7040968.1 response regulator [Candidatus Nitronereus thalassa]